MSMCIYKYTYIIKHMYSKTKQKSATENQERAWGRGTPCRRCLLRIRKSHRPLKSLPTGVTRFFPISRDILHPLPSLVMHVGPATAGGSLALGRKPFCRFF